MVWPKSVEVKLQLERRWSWVTAPCLSASAIWAARSGGEALQGDKETQHTYIGVVAQSSKDSMFVGNVADQKEDRIKVRSILLY